MTNLDIVRAACIKANPVKWKDWDTFQYAEFGLADVLLAIGNAPKGYIEYEGGGRSSNANLSINSSGICMNENGMHLFEWNLRKDSLEDQSPECLQFLVDLLHLRE